MTVWTNKKWLTDQMVLINCVKVKYDSISFLKLKALDNVEMLMLNISQNVCINDKYAYDHEP